MAHFPVLLNEVLQYLDPRSGDFIIDGTLDGGGHAKAILSRLGCEGLFLGIDLDNRMIEKFRACTSDFSARIELRNGNFCDLAKIVASLFLPQANGLLLDLGFSSLQLGGGEEEGIGISFLRDEPLSMRYDRNARPLSLMLSELREEELADIIFRYSGERYSRRIASAIRRKLPIDTTFELVAAIESALPRSYERGRIHRATRTFQALRIFANDELRSLEQLLSELPGVMAKGARVCILTFHSLEDALVKKAFVDFDRRGLAERLFKKPIVPSGEELAINQRSRSAKLRAVRFL